MSDNQVIPEAAVEAAAKQMAVNDGGLLGWVLYQSDAHKVLEAAVPHVFAPVTGDAVEAAWSRVAHHFDDTEEESWKEEILNILEAAAPHMLAEAWEAGWKASSDWSIYIDMGGDEPECDNPYRSQS